MLGVAGCLWVIVTGMAGGVFAQEVVGRRLFADQLVIPEPFIEDELSFPSILHIRQTQTESASGGLVTDISGELKKRLTAHLEASVSGGLTLLHPEGHASQTGFDNLTLGLKYQVMRSPTREAVAAIALAWEVGGTGRTATGAGDFDTISPTFLVGKGLGDLPDALASLKPLALTGVFGASLPSRATTQTFRGTMLTVIPHPNVLRWGVVMEYSLPYLQAYVRDVRLPPPLNSMVPLMEFDFQTAIDRGAGGQTSGTANIGVVWVGQSVQVGCEAVVLVNSRSGMQVGGRAFMRIGLDELFSERWGRPLFGGPD
jgi:hypothetical protein